MLRERAQHFGVKINAIWYACKQMKLTTKKTLLYTQRNHRQRIKYLRQLRQTVLNQGSSNLVYIDESGSNSSTFRPNAWSPKGQKVHGKRSGSTRPRTSLIAAKRGKKILATVLFEGSTNLVWFNQWLEQHLIPELSESSTLILDNARFHKKHDVETIAAKAGHQVSVFTTIFS